MNNITAWMIRQDGKAFSCICHYYGCKEDVEETIYASEWLYQHTVSDETKRLTLDFIAAYGEQLNSHGNAAHNLLLEIKDKQYNFLTSDFILSIADSLPSNPHGNIQKMNEQIIRTLNGEFLRARLGGMYDTVEGCRDMYFRVSDYNFDWMPIIKDFVCEHVKHIDTVTVLWDLESVGKSDFLKDDCGRNIDALPISEFL